MNRLFAACVVCLFLIGCEPCQPQANAACRNCTVCCRTPVRTVAKAVVRKGVCVLQRTRAAVKRLRCTRCGVGCTCGPACGCR